MVKPGALCYGEEGYGADWLGEVRSVAVGSSYARQTMVRFSFEGCRLEPSFALRTYANTK